jgi:ankyrin repeat protein
LATTRANAQEDGQENALVSAAERGNLPRVRALIAAKVDLNARGGYNGDTALIAAYTRPDIVQLLLKAGADKDATNNLGYTPLIVAAENGSARVVKLLLDAGADIEATERNNGYNALTLAAEYGYVDVVKLLLDAGADKEATDLHTGYMSGRDAPLQLNFATPLIYAAAEGHAAVVRLLLSAGANKEAKDHWGHTALQVAKENHHPIVVKLLLDAGEKE